MKANSSNKAVGLLRNLIQIPSPSGDETQVGKYLQKRLSQNFAVSLQRIGDRFNILATCGEPKVLFSTHMDTVPGGPKFKETDTHIIGRGACDAKGIMSAMIVAGETALKIGLRNFGFLFDVDEETNFAGIKSAINFVDTTKINTIVIGEPTDNIIAYGQKGLIGFTLKATGKSAPGAMPEKGKNAIQLLIRDIQAIQEIAKQFEASCNVGIINGGTACNVVPDHATASIELRTKYLNDHIIEAIGESIIGTIDIKLNFDPVDACTSRRIVPFFTELYFWQTIPNKIILGPGEYKYAHSDNEQIKKKDLARAIEIYLDIIKRHNKKTSQLSSF